MLSDFGSDALAIFGAVGTAATLVGLFLTYRQSRDAATAAEAAERAAKEALEADKSQFKRYMVSNAHRYINEAKIFVQKADWHMAAVRMSDLADHAAQVSSTLTQDTGWDGMATELREWEAAFRRISASEISYSRNLQKKWHEFVSRTSESIDRFYGPYNETTGSVRQ